MLSDERRRARPGGDRVQALDEARPNEGASAVALLARPVQTVKLRDERGHLGRVEEGGKLGDRRARWYLPKCQARVPLVWSGLGRVQPRRGLLFYRSVGTSMKAS